MRVTGARSRVLVVGVVALLVSAACGGGGGGSAAGAGNEGGVDFSGESITVTACVEAGGGVDIITRFFMFEAAKKLPGNPRVQVEYDPVIFRASNEFYSEAEPDGTEVFACYNGQQLSEVLGRSDVEYNSADFEPVFVIPNPNIYVARTEAGISEASDVLSAGSLVYGHQGADIPENIVAIYFDKLVDEIELKYVFTYPGGGDVQLAFLRGEIDMMPAPAPRYVGSELQDVIEAGEVIPLFQQGSVESDGSLVRNESFTDIPTSVEFLESQGKTVSEKDVAIFTSMAALSQIGLSWFLPPGTPDEVVAAWEEAMQEVLDDPELVEKAKDVTTETPILGSEAKSLVEQAVALPDDVAADLRQTLEEEFDVDLGA